jgi:hypothetical protein
MEIFFTQTSNSGRAFVVELKEEGIRRRASRDSKEEQRIFFFFFFFLNKKNKKNTHAQKERTKERGKEDKASSYPRNVAP